MKLFDTISYNRGIGEADGNNYWKKFRTPHFIYIAVMLLVMSVCVGVVSLFVCSAYMDHIDWEMFLSYFESPAILALNILPCVLLVFFTYFVSGRAWVAFTAPSFVILALTLVNYYKIRLRTEAFTAKDFSLIGEAAGILPNYTIEVTGRLLLAVGALIFGTLFALFLMRGVLRAKWTRIIGAVLTAALCAGLFVTVYSSDKVYAAVENDSERIEIDKWAQLDSYVSKGFLFPFLHTVKDAFPEKPEGYDPDEAAEIIAAYPGGHIEENKKVDVIAVMLEAYTDLSEHEEIKLTEDIYAPFHKLEAESFRGHIVPNTFGGGTVDAERSFLTGYTEQADYNTKTNSFVRYLSAEGYHTEGVHPGLSWFYNRKNINEYLGFDNYYFLGDLEGLDREDSFFFPTLSKLYAQRDKTAPYFSFSVSFQNHGAYDSSATVEKSYVSREGLSEGDYNCLNNYLAGIADTTERIAEFVDGFRSSADPVVLVFFGDHMPLLGDGNSVYTSLGINLDTGSEEGFYNYYRTPFIIWANDAAKAALGNDFNGDGGSISPCFLMDTLFNLCGWEGPAFMGLSNELYSRVSVVSHASGWFCEDGNLTAALTDGTAEIWERFDKAQYYEKYNFNG